MLFNFIIVLLNYLIIIIDFQGTLGLKQIIQLILLLVDF